MANSNTGLKIPKVIQISIKTTHPVITASCKNTLLLAFVLNMNLVK